MAKKILVIDDEPDTLRLVALVLKRQGYDVVTATEGKEGIKKAVAERPDLIILDVMMPGMDGFEIAKVLRSAPRTSKVPILMFTAKGQLEDKLKGFEVGADDYITKPAHPAELLMRVKKLLFRAPAYNTASLEEAPPTKKAWVVGFIGAKGGLGTSSLVLNLPFALQKIAPEEEIIACDLVPGHGTISTDLGYPKVTGLANLLSKKSSEITREAIEDELLKFKPGISFLTSSYNPTESKFANSVEAMGQIVEHLSSMASFVLLDMGTYSHDLARHVLPKCNEVVVIIDGFPDTQRVAKALIDHLLSLGFGYTNLFGVIYNRVRGGLQITWETLQQKLGVKILTVIPAAPELAHKATSEAEPMVLQKTNPLITEQIRRLARHIVTASKGTK